MTANQETSIEIGSLARLLAESLNRQIAFYERELHFSKETAREQGLQAVTFDQAEKLSSTPADQISWFALSSLIRTDPERGLAVWERVKDEARKELASGIRAATVLDFDSTPWTRARFAALRESFYTGWQPRDGVERGLVDLLAQLYSEQLAWLERFHLLSTGMASVTREEIKRHGDCEPPRVSASEAVEEAAGMVDRFNRLFLRSLRGLRDLRRYSVNISIANPTQVNVGAIQQNVAQVQASAKIETGKSDD